MDKLRGRARRAVLARQPLERLQAQLAVQPGVMGLCYHALDAVLDDYPYRTHAAALDDHLRFLGEIGDFVTAAQAMSALRDGTAAQADRLQILLTFDDGYACNLHIATPVLERHAVPATLFAPRDLIRAEGPTWMDEAGLKTLAAHPLWDVGGHGISHNVLTAMHPADQRRELQDSHDWLTDLLGQSPQGFAYPQGQLSPGIVSTTREIYSFACATDRRTANTFDPYQFRRYCPVQGDDNLHDFAQSLLQAPTETGEI